MAKTILIIDDDQELCNELADILCGEGYAVECAFDAARSEEIIRERLFGLYLLDYKMAGLTGIDLMKKIKVLHSSAKILVISGRPSIDKLLVEAHVSEMIVGIISKPFDIELLLEKVKSAL